MDYPTHPVFDVIVLQIVEDESGITSVLQIEQAAIDVRIHRGVSEVLRAQKNAFIYYVIPNILRFQRF